MDIEQFIKIIKDNPESIAFDDTMNVIAQFYEFTESGFTNGTVINQAGQNSGSCKLFAFAKLHQLTELQTLACFGEYYHDVKNNPEGNDHQNIRQFMQNGWSGIEFEQMPLQKK